jgi:hypothetical protein
LLDFISWIYCKRSTGEKSAILFISENGNVIYIFIIFTCKKNTKFLLFIGFEDGYHGIPDMVVSCPLSADDKEEGKEGIL